jgi:hypothetical protein
MIIRWLWQALQEFMEGYRTLVMQPILVRRSLLTLSRLVTFVMSLSCLGLGMLPVAQAADSVRAVPVKTEKVVAAGFGFQNVDSSSITVKTYNADSGEVLSDETYELDIKEEGSSVAGQPRERVFAGGVGPGADGLSEFTLRVYDAANGRFLWEGRLNLGVSSDTDMDVVRVAAQVRPRAMVSRISQPAHTIGQPYFLIRAVNPETGQLMWSDQFSTEGTGTVRAERIGRSVVGREPITPQEIDFRIRMFDDASRQLLWEDRVTQAEEGEGTASGPAGEAAAGLLPGSSIVQGDRLNQDRI